MWTPSSAGAPHQRLRFLLRLPLCGGKGTLSNHEPRWVFLKLYAGIEGKDFRSNRCTGGHTGFSSVFCSFWKVEKKYIFFSRIIKLPLKYMNTRQAPKGKDASCLEKMIQLVLSTGLEVRSIWPSDDKQALFQERRGTRHTIKEARDLQFTFALW